MTQCRALTDENILCHQNIKNIVSLKFPDFLLISEKKQTNSLTGKMPLFFPDFQKL